VPGENNQVQAIARNSSEASTDSERKRGRMAVTG
jgi:hypothetical protein